MISRVYGAIKRKLAAMLGAKSPYVRCMSFVSVHYRSIFLWKPDIIQSHDLSTLPLAVKVADGMAESGDVGTATKRPVIIFDSHELEAHRNPPLSHLEKMQVEWIEKKFIKQVDFVTTVSEPLEQYLRNKYKLKNTALILNSPERYPDPSHPRWQRRSSKSIRQDLSIGRNDFLVVCVGLITVNRGIESVLEALTKLPPEIKFAAVGPSNPVMRETLVKYARSLSVNERFFIVDPVNPPEVYRYISSADAAILPGMPVSLSYEFSLPNKFFECSFAGLPLIASDLPEVARLVKKHKLGVTYYAEDIEELAAQILEVRTRRAHYEISEEKRLAMISEYGWEAQSERLLSIVTDITDH